MHSKRPAWRKHVNITCQWLWRHRWLAFALILAGISLQAFVELAEEIPEGTLRHFDIAIFTVVRTYRSTELYWISIALSLLLMFPFVLGLILPVLLYLILTRRYILALGLGFIPPLSAICVELLKALFHRARPLTSLLLQAGYSFPSGHATDAVVVYGLLGYIAWKCWAHQRWARILTIAMVMLLILATGVARIYLEVHYPSDVLAGWAAGSFIVTGSMILLEVWQYRTQARFLRSSSGAR